MKSVFPLQKNLSWSESACYTFFLFELSLITLPLARYLAYIGIYSYFFHGVFITLIGAGTIFLIMKFRKLSARQWTLTLLIMSLYGALFYSSHYDSEKLHLVTYSTAAWIYARKLPGRKAWGLALLVSALDEIFQHFIPGRFFQLYDIFINATSALLALILIQTLRPAFQKSSS